MKNKKKAFTLVELLAVIVILAVILVIAIPQIMNTIETARISSFKDSAILIAEQAEKDYISQQVLNKDYNSTSIPCSDVAKLNNDYDSCVITYNNGIATVTLKGKDGGKFSRIKCTGTKDNMKCAEKEDDNLEYVYSFGEVLKKVKSYEIDYEKCMEVRNDDKYCKGEEVIQTYGIEKDIKNGAGSAMESIGIIKNVVWENEDIKSYEIDYEKCMEVRNDDKYCKGEEVIQTYGIEKDIKNGAGSAMESIGIIKNVVWENEDIKSYEIDYDRCMVESTFLDEINRDKYCKGEEAMITYSIEQDVNSDDYFLESEGIIKNAVYIYELHEPTEDYTTLNSNVFLKLPKNYMDGVNLSDIQVCISNDKTNNEPVCITKDVYSLANEPNSEWSKIKNAFQHCDDSESMLICYDDIHTNYCKAYDSGGIECKYVFYDLVKMCSITSSGYTYCEVQELVN